MSIGTIFFLLWLKWGLGKDGLARLVSVFPLLASVLINRTPFGFFHNTRGLRQGARYLLIFSFWSWRLSINCYLEPVVGTSLRGLRWEEVVGRERLASFPIC